MEKPIVLGNGIVADTVLKKLEGNADHFGVVSGLKEPKVLVDSFEGLYEPILFDKDGLSWLYHGVTPLKDFFQYVGVDSPAFSENKNIVPFKVPRPKKRPIRIFDAKEINSFERKIYSCLSVVGNLSLYEFLNESGKAWRIGDHVCSTIGYSEYKSEFAPLLTRFGVIHPVINISNKMQLSFRPRVDEKLFDLIMTNGLLAKLKKLNFEKLRAAAYLKLGINFFKKLDYECFVQFRIENAYTFKNSEISMSHSFKQELSELYNISKYYVNLREWIPFQEAKFYSGIHLSSDLPRTSSNLIFLDTSLAESEKHPTLASCNEIYNKI